ncbi:MAG: sulfatase [Candidatus Solibacter usitatus]|nr:sulfatase [Candidatus Solibacter usitatus]
MQRRQFLAATAAFPVTAQDRRPNVIVILADDMGYNDVGFQGAKDIPTPHLDSIAKTGVRFTNGYVSHPFCSPTRAGLLTGRYQQRFGHENNPRYDPADAVSGLPLDQVTLPQVLQSAGYKTGIAGKWHLGATPAHHPLRRGFDEHFGFIGGGHDYFQANGPEEKREYFIPIERDGKPAPAGDYLTDAFSREACAFIRRHREHPFFLYVAYNTPHTPLQPADKYLARAGHIKDELRRKYAAMVMALDDGVGKILATLRETNLDSGTIIFFMSDNGGPVGINGSDNSPLRNSKGTVYEGGIRVPFAVRWPGRIMPAVYHHPVISLDVFPTAAALAGAKLPKNLQIDGVDLLPHLTGAKQEAPHKYLHWRWGGGPSWAIRDGRYKLVKPPVNSGKTDLELFDLTNDIGETKDISDSHPKIVSELRQVHENWNRELIPPRFESPQPAAKKKKA